jgi:hypothetical protein
MIVLRLNCNLLSKISSPEAYRRRTGSQQIRNKIRNRECGGGFCSGLKGLLLIVYSSEILRLGEWNFEMLFCSFYFFFIAQKVYIYKYLHSINSRIYSAGQFMEELFLYNTPDFY